MNRRWNSRPEITAISATPEVVNGATTQLSVTATDAEGDTLSYTWTAITSPDGANPTIPEAKDPEVTFDQAGNYVFSCRVSDSKPGGVAVATVAVTVEQTETNLQISYRSHGRKQDRA